MVREHTQRRWWSTDNTDNTDNTGQGAEVTARVAREGDGASTVDVARARDRGGVQVA